MSLYHLNHFYNNPYTYYSCIPLHSLQLLENEACDGSFSLFSFNNVLFHGFDLSLNEFYANLLLSWHNNNKPISYRENIITIDTIDVVYYTSKYSVKISFNKQTNKEKNASIAFLKQTTSIKNAYYEKHIIYLSGLDKLNTNMQYRLRRIIEKTSAYCVYISTTNNISKITNPIRSRFLCMRVPALSQKHLITLGSHIYEEYALLRGNNNCLGDVTIKAIDKELINHIKKNVVYLQDLFMSLITYSLNPDEVDKNYKTYNFFQNELNHLFKYMQKTTLNTFDLVEMMRSVIYKINHYNPPVNQIACIIMDTFTNNVKKASSDQIHALVDIISNFDHLTIKINNCKIIYAYENMFLSIFRLIKRV
jgi:hypothetical protein